MEGSHRYQFKSVRSWADCWRPTDPPAAGHVELFVPPTRIVKANTLVPARLGRFRQRLIVLEPLPPRIALAVLPSLAVLAMILTVLRADLSSAALEFGYTFGLVILWALINAIVFVHFDSGRRVASWTDEGGWQVGYGLLRFIVCKKCRMALREANVGRILLISASDAEAISEERYGDIDVDDSCFVLSLLIGQSDDGHVHQFVIDPSALSSLLHIQTHHDFPSVAVSSIPKLAMEGAGRTNR